VIPVLGCMMLKLVTTTTTSWTCWLPGRIAALGTCELWASIWHCLGVTMQH
jgi:hypothetical protein